jgi:hypothetical protein
MSIRKLCGFSAAFCSSVLLHDTRLSTGDMDNNKAIAPHGSNL